MSQFGEHSPRDYMNHTTVLFGFRNSQRSCGEEIKRMVTMDKKGEKNHIFSLYTN
jgi:hypothetical protein